MRTDELVLGELAQLRQADVVELEPKRGTNGAQHSNFERCARGQAGTERHIRADV